MKKLLTSVFIAASLVGPVTAEPVVKDYSYNALGCMILLECTRGVDRVKVGQDLGSVQEEYKEEYSRIIAALEKVGVAVYIADERYFPHNTNGVYKPKYNRFFIRRDLLEDRREFIKTLRHEAWHAVQDCMAGGMQNAFIAQVYQDKDIPEWITETTARVYGLAGQGAAVAWEADANTAEIRAGDTARHLEMCAKGPLWEQVEPTPMTKEWLIGCGWMANEGKYKVYSDKQKATECVEGNK
jgi:hypothetical protein